jgi:hypothetical protein
MGDNIAPHWTLDLSIGKSDDAPVSIVDKGPDVLDIHLSNHDVALDHTGGNVGGLVHDLEPSFGVSAVSSVKVYLSVGVSVVVGVHQQVEGLQSDVFRVPVSLGGVRLEGDKTAWLQMLQDGCVQG